MPNIKKNIKPDNLKPEQNKRKSTHSNTCRWSTPHSGGYDKVSSNSKGKPLYAEATANTLPSDKPLQIVTNFLNELKLIINPLPPSCSNIPNKQNPTPHHCHSLLINTHITISSVHPYHIK